MRSDDLRAEYIQKYFVHESPQLQKIRESHGGRVGINIAPHEAKYLQLFIKLINAKKIIELGCFYGYSTIWMAQALSKDGHITSIEYNKEHYQEAQKNIDLLGLTSKITLKLGQALNVLPKLEGPFDLIFIDANKSAYIEYLDWAEKNIRKGGLIIGDNTFLFGHMTGEKREHKVSQTQKKIMQEFNERLANPEKYQSILLPTYEGMTIAMKLF